MGALYDSIAAFDRGIADRWKARTKENADHKLRAADIDAIVGPMMRTEKKITQKQANAIVTFVKAAKIERADVAPIRQRLTYYVKLAEAALGLEREPLVGADLLPIYAALSSAAVLKLNFKSPKTSITYAPIDYLTVRKLIEMKEIICAEVRISELANLTRAEGVYSTSFNILTLYSGQTPIEREMTIVHEATHAIQDFRDAKGIATHFEADAFVAEAVVLRTLNRGAEGDNDIESAALKAADIVLEGTAQSTQAWRDAYDAVLKAVNGSPGYSAKSRLMVDWGQDEKNRELDVLKAAVAELEKGSKAFRDWAKEALDETFVTPIRRIPEVLP